MTTCVECGAVFERTARAAQKYCSLECRYEVDRRRKARVQAERRARRKAGLPVERSKTCAQCGATFITTTAAKYCSDACRKKVASQVTAEWRRKKRAAAHAVRQPLERPLTCAGCGASFTATHHLTKYCTTACRHRAEKQRERASRPPKPPAIERTTDCPECGSTFTTTYAGKKFCSKRCGRRAHDRRRRAVRSPNAHLNVPVPCALCGDAFLRDWPNSLYCSPSCRATAQAAVRKRNGRKRRARKAGATIEEFDRFEIFERDGWVCQLCGEMTDPLAVVPEHMAPTIDHVVPLARGGAHSAENVQCAHFVCNARKKHGSNDAVKLRIAATRRAG